MNSSKRQKIVLIGPMPPPFGGVSVHLQRLLMHFEAHPDFELSVIDLRRLCFHTPNRQSRNWMLLIQNFLSADKIHIHISKSVKLLPALLARALGKELIYTHHNVRELDSWSTRLIFRLAHKIILVQPSHLPAYNHKIRVIPAYLPALPMAGNPVVEERKNAGEKWMAVMSTAGTNFRQRKLYGIAVFLQSLHLLNLDKEVPLQIFILDPQGVMTGQEQLLLNQVKTKYGIRIRILQDSFDFHLLLPQLDLYVRPVFSDGDAISVREALAAGVSVIASDVVRRPEGVIVFPSGNAAELAELIQKALESTGKNYFPQPDFSKSLFEFYSK